MNYALGGLVMWATPIYPFVQLAILWFTRRWTGVRILAILPLLAMIPIYIFTWHQYSQQSNLWPLFMIFGHAASLAYLAILGVFLLIAKQTWKSAP